ncbi:hypothetical protein FB451DRAFT_1189726 [Mycena latifolia]|nr:hypothetical protein FB451DRAFT_1189726 [Mycena latifolia]
MPAESSIWEMVHFRPNPAFRGHAHFDSNLLETLTHGSSSRNRATPFPLRLANSGATRHTKNFISWRILHTSLYEPPARPPILRSSPRPPLADSLLTLLSAPWTLCSLPTVQAIPNDSCTIAAPIADPTIALRRCIRNHRTIHLLSLNLPHRPSLRLLPFGIARPPALSYAITMTLRLADLHSRGHRYARPTPRWPIPCPISSAVDDLLQDHIARRPFSHHPLPHSKPLLCPYRASVTSPATLLR